MRSEHAYNLHIVLRPADDLPGKWVAHCLDFDVVTYGDSFRDAFAMARESIEMVVTDDLASGRDPDDRRAPRQFWDELWKKLMPHTVMLPLEEAMRRADVEYVIVQATLTAFVDGVEEREREPEFDAPVAATPCHVAACNA
jgi:hypothetical protein